MFERLLIAAVLIAAGAALYFAWTRWQLWRVRQATGTPGLETLQLGRPAILYFTAPNCAPCRTVQRPALAALQAELGEGLQVITLDAAERPDAADYWGVLSVPTTFVLDRQGRARRVNHGVAGADKLRGQLRDLGELRQPEPAGRAAGASASEPSGD
jgi:thioredoxin 1